MFKAANETCMHDKRVNFTFSDLLQPDLDLDRKLDIFSHIVARLNMEVLWFFLESS